MELFRVIKSGLFTTVQDRGRHGFQKFGVPISGAMDKYGFASANLLVGNSVDAACLEITLLGPEFEVLNKAQIAVAGADFSFTVNDNPMSLWQTVNLEKGDVVAFYGAPRSGCRAYLAVRGGIDVPVVLGSRSTNVRGGFGGYGGRALRADDLIQAFAPEHFLGDDVVTPNDLIPNYAKEFAVDVVQGPQDAVFAAEPTGHRWAISAARWCAGAGPPAFLGHRTAHRHQPVRETDGLRCWPFAQATARAPDPDPKAARHRFSRRPLSCPAG